jgi:hypothetical protein
MKELLMKRLMKIIEPIAETAKTGTAWWIENESGEMLSELYCHNCIDKVFEKFIAKNDEDIFLGGRAGSGASDYENYCNNENCNALLIDILTSYGKQNFIERFDDRCFDIEDNNYCYLLAYIVDSDTDEDGNFIYNDKYSAKLIALAGKIVEFWKGENEIL